jgi:hypothetical protein
MHSLFSDITSDPQPLAVGDRVQYNGGTDEGETFTGTVAEANGETVAVCKSGDPLGVRVHGHQRLFTRIERSHPWQGECFDCHISLNATTACRYDGFAEVMVHLCRSCWEEQTTEDNKYLARDQEYALEDSRDWMRERYPDDPRWQEPTSVEEA